MFQNMGSSSNTKVKGAKQNYKIGSEELKQLAKIISSKKNLIVYVVSFMISMVSFGGDLSLGIAPFGMAVMAAFAGTGIPIAIIYMITLIGSYIGLGQDITANYLLTSVVFFISLFIMKTKKDTDENEKLRLGKNVVVSILAVRIVPMLFSSINFSQLILAIISAIVTYIFYKIFVNSIDVIYEFEYKKVFSIEEIIGASLLIAIAISALSPINILGFSLKNILCILIVLILGWKNGILVGTTGGVTIGIVLGIIGNESPMTVAAYAIAGMLAGIFSKIGKIGVIVGFIAGNVLVTYVADGQIEPVILFQEILFASLGLLLIPKKAEALIDDLFGRSAMLPETTIVTLDESKETASKLDSISETISEIAKSYEEVAATVVQEKKVKKNNEDEKFKLFKSELEKNLEGLEDNILYEDIKCSNDIVKDIFTCLADGNNLTKELLVVIFARYNNYIVGLEENENNNVIKDINKIIDILNKSYRESSINLVWQKKMNEKNKDMESQLQTVSEVISDLAEDIKNTKQEKYAAEKEQIKRVLASKGIIVSSIRIIKNESERYMIKILAKNTDNEEAVSKMEKIISKVLKTPMGVQRKKFNLDSQNQLSRIYIYC